MRKKDYECYINDLFKISPSMRFVYGKKDKEALAHIENSYTEKYRLLEKKIYNKYKKTNDIELKQEIENNLFYDKHKLYLLLFSSYTNMLIDFNYANDNIYPKNSKAKKSRIKDFDEIIKSAIERAKEGLKENITYPKIIIKKFLKQIKPLTEYKYLYDFIKKEYYPYCRNEIGLCYIKEGKEIYKNIIRENIGYLDLSPEKIHNIGLSFDLKPVKSKITYKSRQELFKDCQEKAKHIFKNIISKYFHYIPKKPFIIVPVPKVLEKNSALGYYNDIEKKVFVNLSYYYEIDKNEVYSFIMHECMHYYHFEYMKHLKVPAYKMYSYSNIALVEGFAHYMETYCEDYDDTNNSMSLLRKLRLIVDTGINYYGWTYKQAFNYLNKYLPNKKTDNINEIDRYICMPGQSLSYLIGRLHIIKLRDAYLNEKKGDIKDFHRDLLIEGLASFTTINKKLNYSIVDDDA